MQREMRWDDGRTGAASSRRVASPGRAHRSPPVAAAPGCLPAGGARGTLGGMMARNTIKARENRLRLTASRQGLTLVKARRRDRNAVDYGHYWLARPGGQVRGGRAGLSLDQVEAILSGRG